MTVGETTAQIQRGWCDDELAPFVPGINCLVCGRFVGSGTTAVAARALGLRCVAIEAEEKWCELAASRLSQDIFDFGDAA